jgi:hypothetical protein
MRYSAQLILDDLSAVGYGNTDAKAVSMAYLNASGTAIATADPFKVKLVVSYAYNDQSIVVYVTTLGHYRIDAE